MNIKKNVNKHLEYIIFGILLFIFVIILGKHTFEKFVNQANGINMLDAIIYINLENRQDRKDLLLKELTNIGANINKIYKVSGVFIPKNGHKGCVQSHILALNMIKMNKWDRVLILEDDAEILVSPEIFNDLITSSIEILDSKVHTWDILMLATANKIIDKNFKELELPNGLKIQKLNSATTASAYIINNNYVDKILNLFNNCNTNMLSTGLSGDNYEYWALDQKWRILQEHDKWFSISQDPIQQRNIWSTTLTESHK